MGFLGFLQRKPSSEPLNPAILKAQAYEATVASVPPIRGTVPVSGNGRSILEQFQKSHPNLRTPSPSEPLAAPPPFVPRLRSSSIGSDAIERPSTAPSTRLSEISSLSRPSSSTQLQSKPVLRPPPKKKYGPYRLPPKVATDSPNAPPAVLRVPTPSYMEARPSSLHSSLRSGHSGSIKGFVDLLDAQARIKPADFYGRVQAAGAKNYGEDVADRNMNEKDILIASLRAQGPQSSLPSWDAPSKAPSFIGDNDEENDMRRARKRHSAISSQRTRPAYGDTRPYPERTSSRDPQPVANFNVGSASVMDDGTRTARRKSLPSYVAPSTRDRSTSTSKGKKARESDATYFPESLRERARAAALDSNHTTSVPVKPNSSSKRHTEYTKRPRDSILHAKSKTSGYDKHEQRTDSEQSLPDTDVPIRSRSAKHSSRRRTISSHASTASVSSAQYKRHSMHSMGDVDRTGYGEDYSEATVQRRVGERSPGKSGRRRSSMMHQVESISGIQSNPALPPPQFAQSTQVNHSPSRPVSKDGPGYHIRNRSLVSLSGRSAKDFDIEGSIPERNSSLRHWSMTSETAGSSLGSPFGRPQSGHTTNTSVDLGYAVPSSRSDSTRRRANSRASAKNPMRYDSMKSDTLPTARAPGVSYRRKLSASFNLDGFSSDDSMGSPRRSRGADEQDLLFAPSGYGFAGSQLPGLPGVFDAAVLDTAPVPRAANDDNMKSKGAKSQFHMTAFKEGPSEARGSRKSLRSSALGYVPRGPPTSLSRFTMPAYSYEDSEEDNGPAQVYSSDEEISFDIPLSRRDPTHPSCYNAVSRYETNQDPIEEEQGMDDSELHSVKRWQKGAKSKRRASASSIRRGRGRHSRLGLDDLSGYADVES
ncbi:hypothetical protein F4780DRAFT_192847 [Xylariomycetidae sp. FL0641]|nr:hypothetical protein F4780DRAFT_192847 [Xylariomycetidae sp. FL0641]